MQIDRNPARRRFEAETEDGTAILEYSQPRAGILDLQHTYVPEGARGKGVGAALVRAALASARDRHEKIVPTCPFVADWIGRHPEFGHLVRE